MLVKHEKNEGENRFNTKNEGDDRFNTKKRLKK